MKRTVYQPLPSAEFQPGRACRIGSLAFAAAASVLVVAALLRSPAAHATDFDDRTPTVSELISALSTGLPGAVLPDGVRTRGVKIAAPAAAATDSSVAVAADNVAAVADASSTAALAPGRVSMRIQFDLNSDRILRLSADSLSNLAAALNSERLKGQSFEVIGHTDVSGSTAHNLKLSQRRAQSVAQFLALVGVDSQRVIASGRGPAELLDGVAPDSAQQRRVEIRLGGRPQAALSPAPTAALAKSN